MAGTNTGFLIQLDAATGAVISGPAGVVNLSEGVMDKFEVGDPPEVRMPPSIYNESRHQAGRTGEQGRYGIPGDPRAFDLLTGGRGVALGRRAASWATRTSATGARMAGRTGADPAYGWVQPSMRKTTSSSSPWAMRPTRTTGAIAPEQNSSAGSLVALKASTGELVWYFQHAAHDIIDLDTGSAPTLTEAYNSDGELRAGCRPDDQAGAAAPFLDRLTGEPIFETEKVPTPPTDAPFDEARPSSG
ncbi:hypothetical protein [Devosia ginsengisoli]|uniref:hypothetical protein n=1 Tax=Devosia ginsengisoli TaxID=400770 RepID=UPI0026ED7137|nr:hypothetical protein [Devosia ginsengisoli]MCR6669792.1 hypothetical protein [Devosia ginsengisoli]